MIVILPSTLIFGWLVPTLCRILETKFKNPGKLIATVYFWNTIGAALGAFCSAYLLIRFIGTERTIQLASFFLLLTGVLFLFLSNGVKGRAYLPVAGLAVIGLAIVFGVQLDRSSLTSGIFYQPHEFVDFGLKDIPLNESPLQERIVYYEEGLNGTVSIHRTGDDIGLRVNGKTDASIGDMSTQILLGALPMMFGPKVERAAVIGLGSGVTPGSALLHEVETVFVVELEGAVVRASAFFDGVNNNPLQDERVTVVEDDGRLFLASTPEKFDVIISEPSNPWIAGASSLITAEFFELASERLTDRGRLMQWVQLYGMNEDMVLALIGAMRQQFKWVYGFRNNPFDSDLMLLGMNHPLSLEDLPEWDELPERARQDLERLELSSTADLLALLEFGPADIDRLLDSLRIVNSDDNLFIELRGPLHAYGSLDPVHELIGSASTSWVGVDNIRLSAERLAEVALSQMWHRTDLALAELLARESLQQGVTPLGQIAVAQWGLYANPEKELLSTVLIDDALSVDPNNGYARYIRAELRYEAGDMSGALEDIDISIDRGVDPAASYRLRLAALTDLELWQEAEALVDELVDATFFELEKSILRDAAIIKRQVGDTSEAIKLMRQFLQYARTDEEAWKMLSGWLTEAGSAEDAALARENAEIVRQNSATFMHREIRALLGQGEEEAVMTLWDQLEKLYPDYRNLAMLHDDVQRLTGGISTSP
jgi:spermidine synthase